MSKGSKWPINRLAEVAHRALELAREFLDELTERLAAGLIDGLAADVVLFEGKRSETRRAPQELKGLTQDVRKATEAGHAFVSAVRTAVVRAGATAAQRKAFGVGMRIHKRVAATVTAGIDAVLSGAAAHPELARAAGMLEKDVTTARTLRAAITGTDAVQETKKEARKTPTAQRNEVARRIEAAVDAIVAVGTVRFFAQPEIADRFLALVPGHGRKSGPPSGGSPT